MDEENEGSLLVGLALGLLFGCVGILVAFLLKGSRTLTGAVVGVCIQIALGFCAGIGIAVLQLLLVNA